MKLSMNSDRRASIASCLGSSLPGRMLSRLAPTDVGALCVFLTGRQKCGLADSRQNELLREQVTNEGITANAKRQRIWRLFAVLGLGI
jgi:hypothetical protein